MANTRPSYELPPTGTGAPYDVGAYPAYPVARTDGVLGRRLMAYLVDLVIILGFTAILAVAIFFLGFLTFGLGWALYAILGPAAALLYNAVTIGGPHQATIGMRMAGLRVVGASGGRVDAVTAAVHALLFWVALGTFVLWLLDVMIGLARSDRRLGHDLLVGLMLVRSA